MTEFTQQRHGVFGKAEEQSRDFSRTASALTHSLPLGISPNTHICPLHTCLVPKNSSNGLTQPGKILLLSKGQTGEVAPFMQEKGVSVSQASPAALGALLAALGAGSSPSPRPFPAAGKEMVQLRLPGLCNAGQLFHILLLACAKRPVRVFHNCTYRLLYWHLCCPTQDPSSFGPELPHGPRESSAASSSPREDNERTEKSELQCHTLENCSIENTLREVH